jgi:hypothetical protein
MKDIICITAHSRPEILHECLNRVHIAIGQLDLKVHVSVDGRVGEPHDKEVLEVAKRFENRLDLNIIKRQPHHYPGNSYNTLEALKEAYHAGPRYIFLIEDDVMVSADFLMWSYAVNDLAKLFASVAVKCTRRNDVYPSTDPSKVWISGSDYASLGVCFPHNSLSFVVPHARDAYYSNMNAYTQREFPKSRFSNEFSEQDGLIIRIMGQWNGLTAWPYVPRAFHSGYYGYHRMDGCKPMGSLEERIKDFKDIMFDEVALSVLNPNSADIIPCSLDGYEWSTLDIDETFG